MSKEEAIVFGERLNAFERELSSRERAFLRVILCDAEAAPENGNCSLDGGARTCGEIMISIHQAYLSPPISLNPQPIPPGLGHFMDGGRHSQ
jgi:hypothetical protein